MSKRPLMAFAAGVLVGAVLAVAALAIALQHLSALPH